MNSNPTRRQPADDGPEHRDGGGAESKGPADPDERGRSSSRSGPGARDRCPADSRREPFSVVIYPVHGPDEGIDVTSALVDTIAMILWKLQGGNEPVNQLEAVMLLEGAMAGRTDASET
ncbi:MAG: hypothetical protein ACYSUQ_04100 [Planctomycetota bacterium]|jgi:hypothetical protein